MQLVVPSAVTKAVSAATITFTTTSINRFFFITLNFQLSTFNYQLSTSEAPANALIPVSQVIVVVRAATTLRGSVTRGSVLSVTRRSVLGVLDVAAVA